MSKKNIVLFLAMLFALFWNIPVFAEEKEGSMSEPVSAYCLEDKLYTFVRFREDIHPEQLSGTLRLNDISLAESILAMPVQSMKAKVHYVLLIDLSTSMQEHVGEVEHFAEELAEIKAPNAVYSVLTFGNQFESAAQNLKDAKEMQSIVDHLQYDGTLSDIYGGVEQAIKYLNEHPQSEGEFVNLLLVTDGNVYLGSMSEENPELEAQKSKNMAELIDSSRQMVFHTLCVNEWDTLAGQAFSTGKGLHLHSGGQDGVVPAQELIKFVGELYRMDFMFRPANEQHLDLKLQMNGRQNGTPFFQEHEISVPLLQASPNTEQEGSKEMPPSDVAGAKEEEKPPAGDAADAEEEEKPPAGETGERDPAEGEAGKPRRAESEGTDNGGADAVANQKETDVSTKQWIAVASILSIVIIILVVIIVILLLRKKEPQRQSQSAPEGSIYMRLDVVSGQLLNAEKEFYFHDQIIIGRSRKCDIVWKDKCVSGENSRIYMEKQKIYIEDLNSKEGTALGGMRLYAPNILRSGEQISIGNVCFVLRF